MTSHLAAHPLFWSALAAALVVGAGTGCWTFARWRGRALELRLLGALAPIMGGLVLVMLVGASLVVSNRQWSPARLAQSTALLHGKGLYMPEDSGPLLCTIYGPVSVLLYAPAALISDLTATILAGVATNMLCMLAPLALFLVRGAPRGERGLALAVFPFAAATLLAFGATEQMIGSIHVDGPAVGLGLLSCALLVGEPAPDRRRLAGAALLAVLAAWTKQVEAPLVAGQLAWLGLRHGRRALGAYFLALALAGVVVSGAFVAWFGYEVLLLNLWTVPAGHPFYEFPPILMEAGQMALPLLLFLGWVAAAAGGSAQRGLRALGVDWGLPLLAFAVLLPTSILARAKEGGFTNSYHSQYYLVAAAGLGLLHGLAARRPIAGTRWVALVACLAVAPKLPFSLSARGYDKATRLDESHQVVVYEFARRHPRRAYFPWSPLATLLADGELYHFEWAVVDRIKSGHAPSPEHVRAHLPAELEWVVYPRNMVDKRGREALPMMTYLAEFDRVLELEDLPGFVAFARSEPGEAP